MAAFDIDFPDDFMSGLLDSEFDEIAETALKDSAPFLESAMKKTCRDVIEHEGDSELVQSIKSSKPKKTKTDAWIVNVSPKGYSKTKSYTRKSGKQSRKYPVSNALKAIWKEYGISGRQPARPFIQKACNSVQETIMDRMQKVYNEKVGAE